MPAREHCGEMSRKGAPHDVHIGALQVIDHVRQGGGHVGGVEYQLMPGPSTLSYMTPGATERRNRASFPPVRAYSVMRLSPIRG